jgi:signal transduction histidine kinase
VFLGAMAIGRRVAAPIEEARRRQMEFTADASHELRTPLSVIEATTTLALSRDRDTRWYRLAFQRIHVESDRIRRLVEDLLWLARLDATREQSNAEPVDVGVLAEQAVDRFRTRAEARDLSLSLDVAGEGVVITTPPEWLDRLLGVLLDNACKYSAVGGTVVVRVAQEGGRGALPHGARGRGALPHGASGRVRLLVDDSGPGIPAEERPRIFDRFHRATDGAGGAGLGLAIADAIVRATGGRWDVGTSEQGGARMSVTWTRTLTGPRGGAPEPDQDRGWES